MARKRKYLSDAEVHKKLKAAFRDENVAQDLYGRLTLYAFFRMYSKVWCSERNGSPPGAAEPLDMVHEAVLALLDGRRHWRRGDDAYTALEQVIRSKISNLARSSENTSTRRAQHGRDGCGRSAGSKPATIPAENHEMSGEVEEFVHSLSEDEQRIARARLDAPHETYRNAALEANMEYYAYYRLLQKIREKLSSRTSQPTPLVEEAN